MDTARLIIDDAQSGDRNMAVDQALLENVGLRYHATLRIYFWQPATVSLGYFQSAKDRGSHTPSQSCPLVRRATGGGAIVHDKEITYSLVVGKEHPLAGAHQDLYRHVHRTVIDTLDAMGISGCTVWCDKDCDTQNGSNESDADKKRTEAQPFLCFQRRSPGDLVIGNDKVVGSAQRRLESGLLQHGSILLSRSMCAPELPGIEDIRGVGLNLQEFLDNWIQQMCRVLSAEFVESELSDQESGRATQIQQERFRNDTWTLKR